MTELNQTYAWPNGLGWERSYVVLEPAQRFGRGVVLWRVFCFANDLVSRQRLSWFPDRAAARAYMLRHPDLTTDKRA